MTDDASHSPNKPQSMKLKNVWFTFQYDISLLKLLNFRFYLALQFGRITMTKTTKLFTISFTKLLSDIINWYGLPLPLYKQYHKQRRQQYVAIIKLRTTQDGPTIKIKSQRSKDLATAKEHAAQIAIHKLKESYQFDIADFNLDAIRHERKKRRVADIKRSS